MQYSVSGALVGWPIFAQTKTTAMKNAVLIFSLFSSIALFSQGRMTEYLEDEPVIVVNDQQGKLMKETQPGFVIFVHADDRDLEKHWVSYLKSKGVTAKKDKGIYHSQGIGLLAISADTVSLFANIDKTTKGSNLEVFVKRNGQFITAENDPNVTVNTRNFMKDCVKAYYVEAYALALQEETKAYDKIIKERDKLIKKKDGLGKSISNKSGDIDKLSDQQKSAESDVKSLKDRKKELEKERELLDKDMETLSKDSDKKKEEMRPVQEEIDRYNARGEQGTKDFQKAVKRLEKMKKEDLKTQEAIGKKSKEIGKSESKRQDTEKKLNSAESKQDKLKNDKDKAENDLKSLKRDLDKVEDELKSNDSQMKAQEKKTDKLKAAAGKIAGK